MSDERWFEEAKKEAEKSTCKRARCGSVVMVGSKIVGRGFNSPPQNDEDNRTCDIEYSKNPAKPKSDRTCCVHAEWRAIIDALRNKGDLHGTSLYFTRVDDNGEILTSGKPYCTVCSRLALDVGISKFYLWHKDGIKGYDTEEYNRLSYDFHTNENV